MSAIPSLTSLRCFDASARLGSFTRAAREVHLTQGGVSHQILGLEDTLGVQLFVRRRSGLDLTPAGRSYWNEVAAALRQLERATQSVRTHKGMGGTLNLCAASSLATYWLMPRLKDFVARHPEVTINLSTRIGPVEFANSPHDAAIEFCEGPAPGLEARLVMPLVLHPYAARDLAPRLRGRRPADLLPLVEAQPLLQHATVPEAWSGWLSAAGLAGQLHKPAEAGPRLDLLSMVLNAALEGQGLALLPAYIVSDALASGRLVRLSAVGWQASRAYYLRYPAWKAPLAPVQAFVAWLGETAQTPEG